MDLYAWKNDGYNKIVYTDTPTPTTSSTLYKADGTAYATGDTVYYGSSSSVTRANISSVDLSSSPNTITLATGVAGSAIE